MQGRGLIGHYPKDTVGGAGQHRTLLAAACGGGRRRIRRRQISNQFDIGAFGCGTDRRQKITAIWPRRSTHINVAALRFVTPVKNRRPQVQCAPSFSGGAPKTNVCNNQLGGAVEAELILP